MKKHPLLLVAGILFAPNFDVSGQPASHSSFTRILAGDVAASVANGFAGAWGDYDGDGYLDLVVGDEFNHPNALYHNNGNGTFSRLTSGIIATTPSETDGLAWGDYDNDGDLDLFVANWQVASVLFRNDGNGDFTRVIDGPMGSNIGRSLSCAWGDYDDDGFLDLVVANRGQNPFFYRNNGDATFAQILTGPIPTLGGGCSFLWSDYDNDGALDLFFIPGFTGASSRLFHNDGAGSFIPVNEATFVGDGQGGCDWGDYDNDGDLDLAVVGPPWNDVLYRNDGEGIFTPITAGGIFNNGEVSVMCAWGDYDNDGWLDLFVTHYRFGGPHDGPNNFLFRNNRDGTLTRIISGRVVQDGGNSIGCAWADYDNDGFLDLYVANGGDEGREPGFLYHNDGNTNRWLIIKCVGAASNRSGIGAKVRLKAVIGGATLWQLREINGGNGYNGSGLRAHFGLGDATNADFVRIEWPSGTVQELLNVAANQILTIKEPPVLHAVGMEPPGGEFSLLLQGGRGLLYTVEHSSNLIHWSALTNFKATTLVTPVSDPSAASAPIRFYRAWEGD